MKWLLTLGLCLLPQLAFANPNNYFGFGAKSLSLGGAGVASSNDFSANFDNPAGLATQDALQLSLGYSAALPTLMLNGQNLEVDDARGLHGGLVVPGKLFGHRVAFSIGLHLPDQYITRLRALPEKQPRFVLYDNHPQRLSLITSAAFELIPDRLTFGVGLTYLSHTDGQLDVAGTVDFVDAGSTSLQTAVDVNFKAARYPTFGLSWKAHEDLQIGLVYRDTFDLDLDMRVDVRGDIVTDALSDKPTTLVEDALLKLGSRSSNLFSPRTFSAGFAYTGGRDPMGRALWRLMAQVDWVGWSEFKSPTPRLTAFVDAGTLPITVPETPMPLAPEFSDILIPRLGGEWTFYQSKHVDLTARSGLYWEPSPAGPQRHITNLVDGDKIGASLGLSLALRELNAILAHPIHLDLGLRYIAMLERDHRKIDPVNPVGSYRSQGHFWAFAATLRFEFDGAF